jgi:4-hydroxy-tetrahydrodipicolinate reductase
MKIGLVGLGKMGNAVEAAALARGWQIAVRIGKSTSLSNAPDTKVYIDFSHPDSVIETIEQLADMGKQIVVGTTGWESQRENIRNLAEQKQVGIIYADNFSLGMHLFLQVVSEAAQLIDSVGGYDVGGFEMHHREKADSPSGTGRMIANRLLETMKSKNKVCFNKMDRRMEADEIHFSSLRCGAVPGTHTVTLSSPGDTLTLTHQAHNREAWARGALDAAEWIQGKIGLFSFEEILEERSK